MSIKGKELVEKRNVLNELRSNNMTVQELRFFSIYLSKINSRDISTRKVRFSLADFQKIMEFGRLNINQLRASTNSLLGKVVNVPDERGGFTAFTLFKRCRVSRDDNDEWYVEIDASDDALPLMFDFKTRYFTYELWNALRLKSANQVRMYEILKQYEHVGKRELTITELRELLGISPDEYPRWDNFKKRVLDSCQQALAENTDISYTYECGKTGKGGKWLTIIFHITKNTNYVDQLTLGEFINLQPEPNIITTDIADDFTAEKTYSNENIELLASACDDEFSEEEMQVIFTIISDKSFPNNQNGIWAARYEYLARKYAELQLQASKRKINNRFNYFKKMLIEEN